LRSGKLERLVLCGESSNLILRQEVKDSTGVVLTCPDNICGILAVLIFHAINGSLCSAAAVGNLMADLIKSTLQIVAETTQSIIYTVETIGYSIVECVGAICKSISLLVEFGNESLLVYCGSNICLCCTRRSTMTATETAETATKSVAITTPTEDEENYDPIMLS
jgi:hypothetical protein